MDLDIDIFCQQGGRKYNEDSVSICSSQDNFFAVVADGLGSHGGGDIASKLAVNTIISSLKNEENVSEETILTSFEKANLNVYENQTSSCKMKSTAVLLALINNNIYSAHLGDSRLYYLKNGSIFHQTTDHSVSQMAVYRGEIQASQIRFHEDRNRILAALGSEDFIKPTIDHLNFRFEKGDAFLLCSDGFWEYVNEEEMQIDFAKSQNMKDWISYMICRISKRIDGTNDNLSAIAVRSK